MLAEIGPLDATDDLAQWAAKIVRQPVAAQDFATGHGIGELFVEPPADFGERLQQEHVHGLDEAALRGEVVGRSQHDLGRARAISDPPASSSTQAPPWLARSIGIMSRNA